MMCPLCEKEMVRDETKLNRHGNPRGPSIFRCVDCVFVFSVVDEAWSYKGLVGCQRLESIYRGLTADNCAGFPIKLLDYAEPSKELMAKLDRIALLL